jgi:RNA polymerase sigma-70 factor (ECF subfamily)
MQECPALSKFSAHHIGGHHDDSDERLVERVAAGDRVAMQLLYMRHHLRVYRFVLRIVNDAATAEDLTSDVFLDVWKHAGRFEGRSRVSTWILSIARYKAVAALRRRVNDPLDEKIAKKIPDAADNPELIVQKQNESAILRQCLTQLSPAHREIIDLVYYHEKSIAEVAEIIDAPQNTVKTRMFHARKRVAALLDARGFDAARCVEACSLLG